VVVVAVLMEQMVTEQETLAVQVAVAVGVSIQHQVAQELQAKEILVAMDLLEL
jgi:hypothetical protein